eukprot:3650293-Pyramimonas_sp.AAC.1
MVACRLNDAELVRTSPYSQSLRSWPSTDLRDAGSRVAQARLAQVLKAASPTRCPAKGGESFISSLPHLCPQWLGDAA